MKFAAFILLGLLAAGAAWGAPPDSSIDLYEATRLLWQDLQARQQQSPAPSVATDTVLVWREAFAGYDLTVEFLALDSIHLQANLPPYLDVLTTQLEFLATGDSTAGRIEEYVRPFTLHGDTILMDNAVALRISVMTEAMLEAISHRFQLYRTLNLPDDFRPPLRPDSTPVRLYCHGRDVDSLDYPSLAEFTGTLRHLADRMLVWAGLVDVSGDSLEVTVKFYVLLTKAKASGHHFLLISETLRRGDSALHTTDMVARLFPFVRTDNLSSIFGDWKGADNPSPATIEIKRQ
jgi:hypothetical protein